MPSHPLSMRKTRAGVLLAKRALESHAGAINTQAQAIKQTIDSVRSLEAVVNRGFLGRFKFLLFGR